MIEIHDIKPIVEIPDVSIYFYYSIIVLLVTLGSIVIFFIYKFLKPKKRSEEYKYYEILRNIDFKNTKKAAYDISKYGRLLAKDERQKRLIFELVDLLSMYKYKKEIKSKISNEIETKFQIFMESIDV
ncbi:hypothetical protein ALC152_05410 [Arcobacter sp. 15-2]|uniref:hypothetical protein n=1 Tax=Arcobacter sp. 15-2 TaxID=3374109 RepID=UPI00399D3CCD